MTYVGVRCNSFSLYVCVFYLDVRNILTSWISVNSFRYIFLGYWHLKVKRAWPVCEFSFYFSRPSFFFNLRLCINKMIRLQLGYVTRDMIVHALPQGHPIRMQGARVQGCGCDGRCTGRRLPLRSAIAQEVLRRWRSINELPPVYRKRLCFEFLTFRLFTNFALPQNTPRILKQVIYFCTDDSFVYLL